MQASQATTTAPQLRQLVKVLQTNDVAQKVTALNQLAALGPAAAPAVSDIIDVLAENRTGSVGGAGFAKKVSPSITTAAINALAKIGKTASPATPYLVPILVDRNELFRRGQVLDALDAIGVDGSSTAIIMRMVAEEGKFTHTRHVAIRLLGKIQPPATDAVEMLQTLAKDESDKQARIESIAALATITRRAKLAEQKSRAAGETDDDAAMRAALDPNAEQADRLSALNKINNLGPKAAGMVPRLIQLLKDKDPEVAKETLDALRAIGPAASAAVPALVMQMLAETNAEKQADVSRTIANVDPTGQRSIPLLQSALEDPFKARAAIRLLDEIASEKSTTLSTKAKRRWCIK